MTRRHALNADHPAVEAARRALANDETNGCTIEQHEGNGMWTCLAHGVSADGPDMCWYVRDMPTIAINAALQHLTADVLRDTPAGRALRAEGWDEGSAMGSAFRRSTADTFPDNPHRKEDSA